MLIPQNSGIDLPFRVRIGIVTKDRTEYLERCLASCMRQSYQAVDVVVWDNSRDTEVIRRNGEIIRNFPRVKHEVAREELSLINARASLMEGGGFDLFCSLDDDAWFMRDDEIALAVREFEKDKKVAGVAFDILSPDRPEEVERCGARETMGYVGCGHVLSRERTLEVGNYAKFPGYYGSEEKDLCLRFLDEGWKVKFLPGVHVWHDKTSEGRDWGKQHRSGTLNDLIFGLLRAPMPDVLYYLPGKAVKLILWGIRGTKEERWGGVLGVKDFLKHAPNYWKQRQPVRRDTFRKIFSPRVQRGEKPRDWSGQER